MHGEFNCGLHFNLRGQGQGHECEKRHFVTFKATRQRFSGMGNSMTASVLTFVVKVKVTNAKLAFRDI